MNDGLENKMAEQFFFFGIQETRVPTLKTKLHLNLSKSLLGTFITLKNKHEDNHHVCIVFFCLEMVNFSALETICCPTQSFIILIDFLESYVQILETQRALNIFPLTSLSFTQYT